jgi:hypothetical protein
VPVGAKRRNILSGQNKEKFWDVVVITSADPEQAALYEEQWCGRKAMGYIPTGVRFHVVHDPPGVKIGNGGATLVALDFLRSEVPMRSCRRGGFWLVFIACVFVRETERTRER